MHITVWSLEAAEEQVSRSHGFRLLDRNNKWFRQAHSHRWEHNEVELTQPANQLCPSALPPPPLLLSPSNTYVSLSLRVAHATWSFLSFISKKIGIYLKREKGDILLDTWMVTSADIMELSQFHMSVRIANLEIFRNWIQTIHRFQIFFCYI